MYKEKLEEISNMYNAEGKSMALHSLIHNTSRQLVKLQEYHGDPFHSEYTEQEVFDYLIMVGLVNHNLSIENMENTFNNFDEIVTEQVQNDEMLKRMGNRYINTRYVRYSNDFRFEREHVYTILKLAKENSSSKLLNNKKDAQSLMDIVRNYPAEDIASIIHYACVSIPAEHGIRKSVEIANELNNFNSGLKHTE